MSTRQESQKLTKRRIYPDETNSLLLHEIERLEGLLATEEEAERRLPFGCQILATKKNDGSKTILRISLDPLRFKKWIRNIEPVELAYLNPCGIAVVKHTTGRWALYLDEQELLVDYSALEPYEIARLESGTGQLGEREVLLIR